MQPKPTPRLGINSQPQPLIEEYINQTKCEAYTSMRDGHRKVKLTSGLPSHLKAANDIGMPISRIIQGGLFRAVSTEELELLLDGDNPWDFGEFEAHGSTVWMATRKNMVSSKCWKKVVHQTQFSWRGRAFRVPYYYLPSDWWEMSGQIAPESTLPPDFPTEVKTTPQPKADDFTTSVGSGIEWLESFKDYLDRSGHKPMVTSITEVIANLTSLLDQSSPVVGGLTPSSDSELDPFEDSLKRFWNELHFERKSRTDENMRLNVHQAFYRGAKLQQRMSGGYIDLLKGFLREAIELYRDVPSEALQQVKDLNLSADSASFILKIRKEVQ